MKKIVLFFISILYINANLFAQNILNGKVVDASSNKGLKGVSLYIPDLKIGSVSDSFGNYSLQNIPNGTWLIQASIIGYASQSAEINLQNSTTANFNLATSNIEMKEVVITGVSSATEKNSNPFAMSIVSQNDLQQNASNNIVEAVANTPGVNAIWEGPAVSKPVIRGLGYNRVVVMNDGVRQEGNQWGDEFGIEVDENSVDRVEILKGPASLAYGSDAMAGVINFLPAATLPDGKIKGSVMANYQTNNGQIGGSFNLAGNQKGFTWDIRYSNKMAHAYQNQYDGYVYGSGYTQNAVKGAFGIHKKWGYSQLTLSLFDLQLGIVEGGRDSATGKFNHHVASSTGEDSTPIADDKQYTQYNNFAIIHQHVQHYKAVWDNNIAIGKGRLGLRLGYQQNFRKEANDPTVGDVYNNYFWLQTLNYDVRYTLPERNHFEVSVGSNGMMQKSEDRGLVYLVPEYNSMDMGFFAVAKKSFDKLSISGGLRFDNRMIKTSDLYTDSSGVRKNTPTSTDVLRFTGFSSNFSGMSGSIGATYDFTKEIYGKLNVARGYRAPNIAECGSNGIHDGTPFYEIGDKNLKAESSLQIDATLGINQQNFSAEFNGFVNQINNYIFAVKLASYAGGDSLRDDIALAMPAAPTYKYVQGDAILSGGEAVLDIHPATIKWLHFKNSFSMVNAVQKNQPDSTKYLPYIPPYRWQSELKLMSKNCGRNLKNVYFKIGIDYNFEQNKVYKKFGNETITPAYTLINAGIGADICCKSKTLFSVLIAGNNLADVAYQSSMSRLKYADPNNVTGRVGVFNMGRNISVKVIVPLDLKK